MLECRKSGYLELEIGDALEECEAGDIAQTEGFMGKLG